MDSTAPPRPPLSREIVAGLSTFAAMAYILAVNPAILSDGTGMDRAALVTATALGSAVGTLLMAGLARLPVALAPGMGLNAFFAYTICGQMGVPWQGALGLVFWTGVLFLALSLTPLRVSVVRAIPASLKTAIQVGIGLFIAFLGLQKCGLVVAHPVTMVTLGELSQGWMPSAAGLALAGIALTACLLAWRVPGAILIALALVSVAGLWIPGPEAGSRLTTAPEGIVSAPASFASLFLQADFLYPFRNWETAWVPLLALLFVDLFDTIGTLVGVSRRAGIADEEGNPPRLGPALVADAAATSMGALLGTSSVTSYIESAAGIEAGGRTWRVGVVVAACFVLSLFLHPLIVAIPPAATAPALVVVGVLMLAGLRDFDWSDLPTSVPAAMTMLLIPFGFGIADGIALGIVLHVVLMAGAGRFRSVHPLLTVLAVLFVLKFVLVGS